MTETKVKSNECTKKKTLGTGISGPRLYSKNIIVCIDWCICELGSGWFRRKSEVVDLSKLKLKVCFAITRKCVNNFENISKGIYT